MTIAFKKVKDAYGWMSNMSPHPVGVWRTAEALFQAMRFRDQTVIDEIRAAKSPMGAKMIAKKNADKMIVVPRSPVDVRTMELIVESKLLEHRAKLLPELMATGLQTIIEDVTSRPNESGLFWGAAQVDDDVAIAMERINMTVVREDGKNWYGQNVLGKIWMKIRAQEQDPKDWQSEEL